MATARLARLLTLTQGQEGAPVRYHLRCPAGERKEPISI